MSKLPAFQFYPGDWRKDAGVQSLNFHDRGVWFEILCFMHESEQRGKLILNSKPMSEIALSKLLGLDNQILTTTLTTLLEYGVASRCESTGALMSRRMVRDEKIREVRKSCGKLGGNPNLLNQNSTTEVKVKPTPSSSVSTSSSTSIIKQGFTKPTISEVEKFCIERKNAVDPERWMNHYESNGWRVGKNPMKNWKAAVMTWEKNNGGINGTSNDGRSPRRKRLDEDAHRITELAERIAGNDRGLHPAHVPLSRPSGSD